MASLKTKRLTLVAAVAAVALSAIAASLGVASCVIADPPAELPKTPVKRPTIVHQAVVPPITRDLTSWPQEFIVPVDADPTADFEWNFFIDYDPFGANPGAFGDTSHPNPGDDAGYRTIYPAPEKP